MNAPTDIRRRSLVNAAVVEHLPQLRAFAYALTRSRPHADDLVHDGIVRALDAAERFEPGTNFRAWMFTILRNLFYDQRRSQWSRVESLDESGEHEPAREASQEQVLAFCDFRRAFLQLAADRREALMLTTVAGMSVAQAAAICHCPVGTIKSRISRARDELQRMLNGDSLPQARKRFTALSGSNLAIALSRREAAPPARAVASGRR